MKIRNSKDRIMVGLTNWDGFKLLIYWLLMCIPVFVKAQGKSELADRIERLSPATDWKSVKEVPLKFNAWHTQGMVKVGDEFFMTAVEVRKWPVKYAEIRNGLDRDEGQGKGHLFRFDSTGTLLADLVLGEGAVYHPGGIDYDGQYIWIPVTEYRPNSFSILYRYHPKTNKLKEVLRVKESIGALVFDRDSGILTGFNWGARKFLSWQLNAGSEGVLPDAPPAVRNNPSFYVDFQDGQYLGDHMVLGSGFQTYHNNGAYLPLGGWEIFDTRTWLPRFQIPVRLWSKTGRSMLNNPCTVEAADTGFRAYFVPDDGEAAVMYIYEVDIRP